MNPDHRGDRRRTAPVPSSEAVSVQMKRMGRKDTAPELALRKALTARGLRYRLHRRDLPGTPDVAFIAARIAVFVDGCFWHGCLEHGVMPKANRQWWRAKLDANRARDARKDRALIDAGWLPVHVWEHEDLDVIADQLAALVESRVSAGAP
jgi:DNA mismatch endonuclease (patch repair protein)